MLLVELPLRAVLDVADDFEAAKAWPTPMPPTSVPTAAVATMARRTIGAISCFTSFP